jgi:RHS repeat-associated protein
LLTGLNVDEYFTRTDSSGTANFLPDALGSTLALTNGSGSTLASYTYEPFGNTAISGTSANTYQFTGRENDGTGLYFNRARYYNPQIGRFISEDPIRFRGGINFSAYVGNNPLNLTDPSGLCPKQNPCAPSGNAPPPGFYADLGKSAGRIENDIYLYEFHRGGFLDAHRPIDMNVHLLSGLPSSHETTPSFFFPK